MKLTLVAFLLFLIGCSGDSSSGGSSGSGSSANTNSTSQASLVDTAEGVVIDTFVKGVEVCSGEDFSYCSESNRDGKFDYVEGTACKINLIGREIAELNPCQEIITPRLLLPDLELQRYLVKFFLSCNKSESSNYIELLDNIEVGDHSNFNEDWNLCDYREIDDEDVEEHMNDTANNAVRSIEILSATNNLQVGFPHQLQAKVNLNSQNQLSIIAHRSLLWEVIEGNDVLSISSHGLVTPNSIGSAIIKASLPGFPDISAQIEVEVGDDTLQSISIIPGSLTIAEGQAFQLKALGLFVSQSGDETTELEVTNIVQWSSSTEGVAKVFNETSPLDIKGIVKGFSDGEAVITAGIQDLTATIDVIVTAPVLEEVQITTKNGKSLNEHYWIGNRFNLNVVLQWSNDETADVTDETIFSSQTSNTASVVNEGRAKGKVEALESGNALIKIEHSDMPTQFVSFIVKDTLERNRLQDIAFGNDEELPEGIVVKNSEDEEQELIIEEGAAKLNGEYYLETPNFHFGNRLSLHFRMKIQDEPNGKWRTILHRGKDNSERTPAIWLRPENNKLHVRVSTTASSNEGLDSRFELNQDEWYDVVYELYYDRKEPRWYLRLYINGVLDTSLGLAGIPQQFQTVSRDPETRKKIYHGETIKWGFPVPGQSNQTHFTGLIDDISVFKRKLSLNEMMRMMSLSGMNVSFSWRHKRHHVTSLDFENASDFDNPNHFSFLYQSSDILEKVDPEPYLNDGYLEFDGHNSLKLEHVLFAHDHSIRMRFKLTQDSTGEWRCLVHKGEERFERSPGIWLRPNNNKLHVRISTSENQNEGFDSNLEVPLDEWVDMVTVLRRRKDGWHHLLYLNGKLDTDFLLVGLPSLNISDFYIGDDAFYDGFQGLVDHFEIYNFALGKRAVLDKAKEDGLHPGFYQYERETIVWSFDEEQNPVESNFEGYLANLFAENGELPSFNEGIIFNGENGASIYPVLLKNHFTIRFWIKLASEQSSEWKSIIHKGNGQWERTPAIWLRPESNRLHMRISTTSSNNEGFDSSTALDADEWYHVTYSVKSKKVETEDGKVRKYFLVLYLHNEGQTLVETVEHELAGVPVQNHGPIILGKDSWYDGFQGEMKDFKIDARKSIGKNRVF